MAEWLDRQRAKLRGERARRVVGDVWRDERRQEQQRKASERARREEGDRRYRMALDRAGNVMRPLRVLLRDLDAAMSRHVHPALSFLPPPDEIDAMRARNDARTVSVACRDQQLPGATLIYTWPTLPRRRRGQPNS